MNEWMNEWMNEYAFSTLINHYIDSERHEPTDRWAGGLLENRKRMTKICPEIWRVQSQLTAF